MNRLVTWAILICAIFQPIIGRQSLQFRNSRPLFDQVRDDGLKVWDKTTDFGPLRTSDLNKVDPVLAEQIDKILIGQEQRQYLKEWKMDPSHNSTPGAATTFRESGDFINETHISTFVNPNLPEGWVCVNKLMMVEEMEYKDEIRCTHILQKSCHDTFQTVFKATEVEECKDRFIKNCEIEYHPIPKTEKIEVCHRPMVRDCQSEGEIICSNEYETVCETLYHENEVEDQIAQCETKQEEMCTLAGKCVLVPRQECTIMKMNGTRLTPETDCRQEIRKVCGSEACPLIRGPRICANELKTFVQDVPQETCHLNAQRICNPTSKIIPKLEQRTKCIDVPREVCHTVQVAAKVVNRPVVKIWCGPNPNPRK